MSAPLEAFETMVSGTRAVVPVRVRDGVPDAQATGVAQALDEVAWAQVQHAYGNAADVPPLLYAVSVGEAEARRAAWWELWGNVHHQGTVYSASAAAAPFLAFVAESEEHPDRVQAMSFLRQLALGDGEHASSVRMAVEPHAAHLMERLEREPDLVRRAIVWLASAYPRLISEHPEATDLVPLAMRATWTQVLDRVERGLDDDTGDEDDDAALDREDEVERWLLAGWTEPTEDSI